MPNPTIQHPSLGVPFAAVSFGDAGENAVAVSHTNPLPQLDHGYRNVRSLVANTLVTPGQAVLIDCSVDGRINLEMVGGAQIALTVSAGLVILPLVVQRYVSSGTTATFSAWVLD